MEHETGLKVLRTVVFLCFALASTTASASYASTVLGGDAVEQGKENTAKLLADTPKTINDLVPPTNVVKSALRKNGARTKNSFLLSVFTDKPEYEAGNNILLYIALENTQMGVTSLDWERNIGNVYTVEITRKDVRDKVGGKVPLTSYGRQFFNTDYRNHTTVYLSLGKPIFSVISLNRLFDLSLGGTYTVRASRPLYRQKKGADTPSIVSSSNTYKFTVNDVQAAATRSEQ